MAEDAVMSAMSGHQRPYEGATDRWLTPPHIIEALGQFDLDPCSEVDPPWPIAVKTYTENGLDQPWSGEVWVNPPYGPEVAKWTARLARHRDVDGGSGIALIFARTETAWFEEVWRDADALLFLRGRLHFHYPDGTRAKANAGAPSVLVAYGTKAVVRLQESGLPGALCFAHGWSYR